MSKVTVSVSNKVRDKFVLMCRVNKTTPQKVLLKIITKYLAGKE